MAKFYLTNKAVEDLGAIWHYTVETWSENQAVIYYSLLIDSCQELANKPNQGKSYEVVEKNILGFKTGEHLIFYRIITENEIEVVRILHGMMDLKNHL
ncbi:type II toxin-antitoxin system RelE/ParE family toxin [Flavobacterium sp. J49]|uniref:type II toxin-antitoxin system RelE/ParE family toxin n=1 Tax=Flavobacterium sp. J49 TaxID=2718534 RepID=UPI00159405A5|nr:type II toxin-antitoxin system RelE/ParE family toxin [Flavobacterium sp. J49]MBF6639913.1 type II toxin-antitoxin system RelE/ParE family toxin [Flavobacterium sp. J49]NIC01158.1 type II toxin-antitoxin system RelE/ParE family toxin [Flavobacterium sp. J49]